MSLNMGYFPFIYGNMSYDYNSLLQSGNLSDVVLVAGGKELRAHKLVLSARSPVFAAMFTHESTKEAQENRVDIIDVDVEALELMVRYIYTGKFDMLDQYAAELLTAADKYQLDTLKSICERNLLSQITTESVCDLLILADMHQATELARKCIDYIARNITQVRALKDGWKKLRVKPDLLDKIIGKLQPPPTTELVTSKRSKDGRKERTNKKKLITSSLNDESYFNMAKRIIFREMAEHYESLLKSCIRSDVVLVAGAKELPAHKLVLSARSPVFAAMFAHNSPTKEAQENRFEITDVEAEVFELLVRYIYTGKVENLSLYAKDLFVAAHKYQVSSLKSICEQELLSQISTESASNLFILADAHQISELGTKCIEYITTKSTEVMSTEGWNAIGLRSDLLTKLCEHLHSRLLKYTNVNNDKKNLESKKKKEKDIDWTVYAAKMFAAADEHQMEYLKTMCVQQLLSEVITTKSLPDLLIFADLHQITELYTKCIDYIATNRTQVMASMGWKRIVLKSDLLAKVCDRLNWNFAEQLLLSPITIKTVSNVLIRADIHQVAELSCKCLDYIIENFNEVLQFEDWKKISVRADLLAKLFKQLSVYTDLM